MSWTCPVCARTFARGDQFHSHATRDLDAHFAGRPEQLRAAFDKLVASLPSDVHVEALRTVIILSARRTFSFITVQAKRLLVGVFLDVPIDSSRVVKIHHDSEHKVGSVIDVRRIDEVDSELRQWLRDAYEVGVRAGPSTTRP